MKVDVAIAGGGLGGLALAAGLLHRGYDAHVFEAARVLRTATGTIITVGGNGLTALERLNPRILPKLTASGSQRRMTVRHVRPTPDGPSTVIRAPAASVVDVRWGEVQRALSELVMPTHVHCGHKATGYTELPHDGHVLLHCTGQPDVQARLVVAADGLRSALRAQMVPQDPGMRYLGSMTWNALLYNPNNSVVAVHGPGECCVWQDSTVPGEYKCNAMAMDVGGGWTYLVVSVASETPAFTPAPACTSVAPERANLVMGGLGKPGSKARALAMLEAAGYDDPARLLKAIPESDLFERCAMDRLPLDELNGSMSSPGKRVVLLGDAAHAMFAGPGQGAQMAFEDAHSLVEAVEKQRKSLLGWQLSAGDHHYNSTGNRSELPADMLRFGEVPSDAKALCTAIEQYEQQRLLRVCRIQRFAAEGCPLPAVRDKVRPSDLGPQQLTARYLEFFNWVGQYPNNLLGDPASTYWKPV